MACHQAATDDDVFDKFRFVDKVGTQCPSQVGEEVRTHNIQGTSAIIHGEQNEIGPVTNRGSGIIRIT